MGTSFSKYKFLYYLIAQTWNSEIESGENTGIQTKGFSPSFTACVCAAHCEGVKKYKEAYTIHQYNTYFISKFVCFITLFDTK